MGKNFDAGIVINGGNQSTNAVLTGIDVVANNARSNGNQGIVVSGGILSENAVISDILIEENSASVNGARGIHVTQGLSVSTFPPVISLAGIINNSATSNANDGIFINTGVPGSGTTSISGNRANSNGVDGIDLNSTGYVLSDNKASKNVGAGIDAAGNTDGGGNVASKQCNVQHTRMLLDRHRSH